MQRQYRKDVGADVEPGETDVGRKLLIPSMGDALADKMRDDAIRKACGDDVFATTILDAIADHLPDGFDRLEDYTQRKVFDSEKMERFGSVTANSVYTINAIVQWYRDRGLEELECAIEAVFGDDEALDEPDDDQSAETPTDIVEIAEVLAHTSPAFRRRLLNRVRERVDGTDAQDERKLLQRKA